MQVSVRKLDEYEEILRRVSTYWMYLFIISSTPRGVMIAHDRYWGLFDALARSLVVLRERRLLVALSLSAFVSVFKIRVISQPSFYGLRYILNMQARADGWIGVFCLAKF